MSRDVLLLCLGAAFMDAGVFLVSVAAGLMTLGALVIALTILLRET